MSGEDCVLLQTSDARWQSFVGEVRPWINNAAPDPHHLTVRLACLLMIQTLPRMPGAKRSLSCRIAFLEPCHHGVKVRGPAKEVLATLDLDEFDPGCADEPAEGAQRDHFILVAANNPTGNVQPRRMLLDKT